MATHVITLVTDEPLADQLAANAADTLAGELSREGTHPFNLTVATNGEMTAKWEENRD